HRVDHCYVSHRFLPSFPPRRSSDLFYFKSALERDSYCSGALNGLAEIRFNQGDLEESRRLLARSQLAYKTAATLNQQGIELVKADRKSTRLNSSHQIIPYSLFRLKI